MAIWKRNNPILKGTKPHHGVSHSPPPPCRPPPRHLAVLSQVLDLWLPKKPKALPRMHFQRPNARQHRTGECDQTMAVDGVCGNKWGGGTAEQGDDVSIFLLSFFGFDILVLSISFYLKLPATSLSGTLPYFVKNGELLAGSSQVRLEIKNHQKNTVSSPKDRLVPIHSPSKWPLPSLPPWGVSPK